MLALAGFDNMRLNVDEKGEDAEYLLSYLPRIRQETFTVGASWRHYAGRHVQTVTLEPQLPEQPQPEIPAQR